MARRKKSTVVDRDRGWKAFTKRIAEMRGAHVKVGVTAEAGAKPKDQRGSAGQIEKSDEMDVVGVAWQNEFGNKRIPERSFIRSTHDENRTKLRALTKRLVALIEEGKISVERALGILGMWMKTKQQNKIDRLTTPPNAPSTIKRKKSSNPLVDLKQMAQSIHYQISIPARAKIGQEE